MYMKKASQKVETNEIWQREYYWFSFPESLVVLESLKSSEKRALKISAHSHTTKLRHFLITHRTWT